MYFIVDTPRIHSYFLYIKISSLCSGTISFLNYTSFSLFCIIPLVHLLITLIISQSSCMVVLLVELGTIYHFDLKSFYFLYNPVHEFVTSFSSILNLFGARPLILKLEGEADIIVQYSEDDVPYRMSPCSCGTRSTTEGSIWSQVPIDFLHLHRCLFAPPIGHVQGSSYEFLSRVSSLFWLISFPINSIHR
jgi:hypothetical protein